MEIILRNKDENSQGRRDVIKDIAGITKHIKIQ